MDEDQYHAKLIKEREDVSLNKFSGTNGSDVTIYLILKMRKTCKLISESGKRGRIKTLMIVFKDVKHQKKSLIDWYLLLVKHSVSNNTIKLRSSQVSLNEWELWQDLKLMKFLITSSRILITICLKNKQKMIDRTKRKIKSTKRLFEETSDSVFLPTHKKEFDLMKLCSIMQVFLYGYQEHFTQQQASFELYGFLMMIFHKMSTHLRLLLEEFWLLTSSIFQKCQRSNWNGRCELFSQLKKS